MSIEAPPRPTTRWRRVAGLDELGQTQGSGLREPSYLIRRADGQVVQLSELLHVVVREVSADRDAVRVAEAVSAAYGRTLSVEGLTLLASKLEPLGLIEDTSKPQATARDNVPRANPVLSLRLRGTLLPARGTRAVARLMAPLFYPPLVVVALVAFVALDVVLIRRASLTDALGQVFATPVFLLGLLAILTSGGLIHEMGHAAACHYGGARPGVIGVGVYLVFPAFFTNVTDSYRLGRAGRLRTDLGGLYFNVWCVLVLGGSYLITGNGLLLLALLLMQIEMVQQLIPTVRFDGYFVLADLAGVPDLFARVRPVLLSLLPGRPADPRVTELRPRTRRVVTGWVLVVVPTLAIGFGWLLLQPSQSFAPHSVGDHCPGSSHCRIVGRAPIRRGDSRRRFHSPARASRPRAVAIGPELGEPRPPLHRPPSCHAARAVEQCGGQRITSRASRAHGSRYDIGHSAGGRIRQLTGAEGGTGTTGRTGSPSGLINGRRVHGRGDARIQEWSRARTRLAARRIQRNLRRIKPGAQRRGTKPGRRSGARHCAD